MRDVGPSTLRETSQQCSHAHPLNRSHIETRFSESSLAFWIAFGMGLVMIHVRVLDCKDDSRLSSSPSRTSIRILKVQPQLPVRSLTRFDDAPCLKRRYSSRCRTFSPELPQLFVALSVWTRCSTTPSSGLVLQASTHILDSPELVTLGRSTGGRRFI